MVSGLQPCQGGVAALAWCWRGWGQLMAAGRGLLLSVPLIARQISPRSRRVKLCAAAGVVPPRSLPIRCHLCPADDLLVFLVLCVLRPGSVGSHSWAGGHHTGLEQPLLKRGRCESHRGVLWGHRAVGGRPTQQERVSLACGVAETSHHFQPLGVSQGQRGAAWCSPPAASSLSTSWWPKIFFLEVLEVSHISADLQIRLQMSLFEMIRGESFCPTASV